MTSGTETGQSAGPATRRPPVPAALVLEDGRIHRGTAFGAEGSTLGEAVFSTAMSGYQETLTDPSLCRQILVSASPHIGNTGWNDEDGESETDQIWVSGLVIRDLTRRASSWRSNRSLESEMVEQGIVGIAGSTRGRSYVTSGTTAPCEAASSREMPSAPTRRCWPRSASSRVWRDGRLPMS